MHDTSPLAPELIVGEWLNTLQPLPLSSLRGRVVLLHAFQMLCPGCALHGVPQAKTAHRLFAGQDLCVLGLHTVFEHHAVMGRAALEAFAHEYRIEFPIAIDRPDPNGDPIPQTMRAYGLQGTPSLMLIDRAGHLRLQHFGQLHDMELGARVSALLAEPMPDPGRS